MNAYSSVFVDYLGEGLAANRPTTLTIAPGALGFFYATDTKVLSLWNGSGWDSDPTTQEWSAGVVSIIGNGLVLNAGTLSGALTVENSGTVVDAAATTLNFTGSGVTVTDAGSGSVNVAIAAGGSSLTIEANGTPQTGVTALNFGSGTTLAVASGVATITAPGGTSSGPEAFVVSQSASAVLPASANNYIGFNSVSIDTDGVANTAVNLSAPVTNTAMQGITVPAIWNGKTAVVVANVKINGDTGGFTVRSGVYRPSLGVDITTAESTASGGFTNPGRSLTLPPVVLATGDIIYLYIYQSTANATLNSGAAANRLGLFFLGGGSGGGTSGATTLAALTDVDETTAPTSGQALVFNSAGKWKPTTQQSPLSQQVYSGPWRGALTNMTTAPTVNLSTTPTLSWGGAVLNTDNFFTNAAPTRLTVPAGVSKVRLRAEVHVASGGSTTGTTNVSISKNGAGAIDFAVAPATGSTWAICQLTTPVLSVAAGDYFEMQAYNAGTACVLTTDTTNSFQIEIVELTTATYRPYDIGLFAPGKPAAGALVDRYVCVRVLTLPVGAPNAQAYAGTAPTAAASFSIQHNETTIGSISFAAGSQTGTFSVASAVTFAAGDRLELVAPASQDATLADVAITIPMQF